MGFGSLLANLAVGFGEGAAVFEEFCLRVHVQLSVDVADVRASRMVGNHETLRDGCGVMAVQKQLTAAAPATMPNTLAEGLSLIENMFLRNFLGQRNLQLVVDAQRTR